MDGGRTGAEAAPAIGLQQIAAEQPGATACWSIIWRLTNKGDGLLKVLAVRIPHGQFKGEELRFEPPIELLPGKSDQFHVAVRCDEPTGLVTENAFIIFSVIWSGDPWRVFVRLRVTVTADGRPETATESITTQRVGFSGVDS